MNARELHDQLGPQDGPGTWVLSDKEIRATILRALALQAAVDESSDGLVQCLCENSADAAAARIILQDQRIVALEQELAELKAHAEAMAQQLTCYSRENDALVAYRAANPKDTP